MADKTQIEDQAFFLSLARPSADTDEARIEARERWNAWRRDPLNDKKRANFERVDFRANGNNLISFEGFEFGNRATFENATFGDDATFSETTFGYWASFEDATFGGWASFEKATFGDDATFSETTFGDWASFENATLGRGLQFRAALFHGSVSFMGEPCEAVLDRLCEERFGGQAGKNLGNRKSEEAAFRKQKKRNGFGPQRILEIYFSEARFCGSADFSGRVFEQPADFTLTHFETPPVFDGATNLQRIDFTGSKVRFVSRKQKWWKPHWTEDSKVAIRLRAFRAIAETTKNHDLERDLYIEERKAERGIYWASANVPHRIVHGFWIIVMGAYWLLADYGRSVLRPAAWLAASIWGFQKIYSTVLAPIRVKAVEEAKKSGTEAAATMGQQYDAATDLLALSNAVPFVGPLSIDADIKKFLLCGKVPQPVGTVEKNPCVPLPPYGYQAAMIGQNVISIILLFFIGLALRNYFKVK